MKELNQHEIKQVTGATLSNSSALLGITIGCTLGLAIDIAKQQISGGDFNVRYMGLLGGIGASIGYIAMVDLVKAAKILVDGISIFIKPPQAG